MLRYRPSEIGLTLDDIERASLRINDRKKTTSVRPPTSLRLSMVVPTQQPTIHRGPERSRDDALIHPDHVSAFHPHLHAEYVSAQHNCTSINQHSTKRRATHRETDSFSDSAESISVSTSPPPVLHYDTRYSKGRRVCANPLSMIRLAAQQPATKNISRPLSSSPNLRPPSRHIAMDNSSQDVIPTLDRLGAYSTLDPHESPWSAWETFAHQFVRCLNREELAALPSFLRTHKSHFPETESADCHLMKYMNEYFGLDYPTAALTPIPYDGFVSIVENAVAHCITVLDHVTHSREINRDSAEYVLSEISTASTTPHHQAQRTNRGSAAYAVEDNTASPLELLQSNLRGLQGSVASIHSERPISEHFEPFHQQLRPISNLPRSRATPATTLQDQENSESVAMSVLSAEFRRLQARSTGSTDDGIMDDTPPRETRFTRHLQG